MPTFTEQTHQLAQALVAAFPDLSFTPDPGTGTLTIRAGDLQLVVAPVAPAPLAENALPFYNASPAFAEKFAALPVGSLSYADFDLLGSVLRIAMEKAGHDAKSAKAYADLRARYNAEDDYREAAGIVVRHGYNDRSR